MSEKSEKTEKTDTKRASSKQPPWEQGDADTAEFGAWLRQQREVREITLREISEASKISLRYLEAMEEDRFDLLPATVFAKGFLRQYARYVGLDADEVVNRYLAARQVGPDGDDGEPHLDGPGSRIGPTGEGGDSGTSWKTIAAVVAAVAVLALAVFLVPRYLSDDESGEAPAGVATTGTAPRDAETAGDLGGTERRAAGESESRDLAAPLVVHIDFQEDSWVEATVDGQVEVSEMRVQGESLELQAEETIELRLGNAGGVTIERNGEPYPLDAASGSVRTVTLQAPEQPEESDGPDGGGQGQSGTAGTGTTSRAEATDAR